MILYQKKNDFGVVLEFLELPTGQLGDCNKVHTNDSRGPSTARGENFLIKLFPYEAKLIDILFTANYSIVG